VIFEVKCPWSRGMRKQAGSRLELHAKQCLLELAAYPSAACLIFAALCFKSTLRLGSVEDKPGGCNASA
jgi:hypothetical protein